MRKPVLLLSLKPSACAGKYGLLSTTAKMFRVSLSSVLLGERAYRPFLFAASLSILVGFGSAVCAKQSEALQAIDPNQAQFDTPPVAPAQSPSADNANPFGGGIQGQPLGRPKRTLDNPNPNGPSILRDEDNPQPIQGIPGQAGPGWAPQNEAMYEPRISRLEQLAFGSNYPEHDLDDRVDHLETEVFSKRSTGSIEQRVSKLESRLLGQTAFGQQQPPAYARPPVNAAAGFPQSQLSPAQPSPALPVPNSGAPGWTNPGTSWPPRPAEGSLPQGASMPPMAPPRPLGGTTGMGSNPQSYGTGGTQAFPPNSMGSMPQYGMNGNSGFQLPYGRPSMPQQMGGVPSQMSSGMPSQMSGMPQQMGGMPPQIGSGMPQQMGGIPPQMSSGMPPQMSSGMPQQMGGVPPQMSSGMPQMGGIPSPMGSGMPQQMGRMPQQMGSGMPQQMGGVPQQMGSGMPQQMGGVPQQMGSGMPQQMGGVPQQMGSGMPQQMGGMSPQMGRMPPQIGSQPSPSVASVPQGAGLALPVNPVSPPFSVSNSTTPPAASSDPTPSAGLTAADRPEMAFDAVVKNMPLKQSAGDYFPAINKFANGAVARWTRFPILVHFPQGSPPQWHKALEEAMGAWKPLIPIKTADPLQFADIEVGWINHLPPRCLGQTNLEIFNGRMRVTVYLLRPSYYLASIPEKTLKRVAMHEFGHAIGIFGHSTDPADLMYAMEGSSAKDFVGTKGGGITARDSNTLKKVYESRSLPHGFQSPHPLAWSIKSKNK